MRVLQRIQTILRSVAVGVIASAVDLIALLCLVEALGLTARVANVPSLLSGVLAQFVGNKFFAFRDSSRAWLRQGGCFALVELVALALNAIAFDVLVSEQVPLVPARVLASAAVYFGFSLPLWSRIFSRPEQEAHS